MKNQALYSLKDKSKKLKCCLLQFFVWRFKGYDSLGGHTEGLQHS